MTEKWALLISPAESMKSVWEVIQFESEDALMLYKCNCDLTKEHYWLPVTALVDMLREDFETVKVKQDGFYALYICDGCDFKGITIDFTFCPSCGKEIDWEK